MLLDIPNTADFSQVQVNNNELINYVVINRGLKRLYDNDEAIATDLSGYVNDQVDPLDARLIVVEGYASDISTMQADISQLQSNTSNYANWNSTYSIVNTSYTDWTNTHTIVEANSAIWNTNGGGGISAAYLSADLDVNIGAQSDGQVLAWNNASQKWEPQSVGASVSTGTVSAIVTAYDNENEWSGTAIDWQADGDRILSATSYVIETSASLVNTNTENGYSWNGFWVDIYSGENTSDNLTRSFYNPLQSASYVLTSGDVFGTAVSDHDRKQVNTLYVRKSNDNLFVDLFNDTLTFDGGSDGGTLSSLYMTLQYKSALDGTYNMPDTPPTHLTRLSACVFGFENIDTDNSYTMFNGFAVEGCTFSGIVGQKFYFSNCYIDLSTVTISTACEFYFDNSCTVDVTADANLTIRNKGIPSYLGTGTDPATVSATFADFTGPYLYNDILYQLSG